MAIELMPSHLRRIAMLIVHKSYSQSQRKNPSTRVFLVLPNVESAALFSWPILSDNEANAEFR